MVSGTVTDCVICRYPDIIVNGVAIVVIAVSVKFAH